MPKQSPLLDLHKKNGALLVEQNDWLLADHFGDPEREYEVVRRSAGIVDLSHRVMLQFTGPDRFSFLQGMLSNDLRPLKMFEGEEAAILTQQGKVVADVRVLCAMNSFYLDMWEPLKEKALAHLNRYLVADEVEINDPNEQWKMLSVQGPRARDLIHDLLLSATLPTQLHHHAMAQFAESPVCIVNADRTGYSGYDLIVQTTELQQMAERLMDLGAAWVGEQAQHVLRVEAGIPRYGIDFDEDNLLLEVDLENAVSFNKGCYLGQEVVERIRSRGHVNKKLCGLLLEGDQAASSGDRLFAGDKDVGQITSSVMSRALRRPIALGYVHKDFWMPGTPLELRRGGGAIGATITSRPLAAPGSAAP
jgi:folate-binding protein YgfZ